MNPRAAAVDLPDELWNAIWRNLSQQDLLAVTHVCALWRKAALAYPTLWCDISFIWTVNTFICECDACLPPIPLRRSTSFEYFCAQVSRSQEMPICLSIDIFSKRTSDLPDQLLETFSRISPRLEHFHFCGPANILTALLSSTPSLPSLRTLTSVRHGDVFSDNSWVDLERPIEFPVVETLDLDGSLVWPPTRGTAGVSLPNVRTVTVYPDGWDAVINLLDNCPTIDHLIVNLVPIILLHPAHGAVATPRHIMHRMPALRLQQPFNLTAEFLVQFHESHFHDFTLDCGYMVPLDWWPVETFRPVRDASHLTLAHYERDAPRMMFERTHIAALDAAGRRRAIDLAFRDLHAVPPIAHYLSLSSIQSLEVDLSLWDEYFLNDDPVFPALSELTIVVYASLEITLAIEEASARSNGTAWFPALRVLRIQPGQAKLRLPMQPVAALIDTLHLPGRLDELYVPFLDRALFQGQAASVINCADAY